MHSSIASILSRTSWQVSLFTIALAFPAILLIYVVLNEIIRYLALNHDFKGPPNRPLVGNLPEMAESGPEKLRQWSIQYGDVYQIQLGNIPIIVVNSAAAAKQLLGHHSHALSSRPVFYTFHQILATTAGSTLGTSPISDSLKRRRRATAAALNKPAVMSYAPYLDLETFTLVKSLYELGNKGSQALDPTPLIRRFALSVALTINYGIRMESHDDELFREIADVENGIVKIRNRTENLMDYIPLLRLNPFGSASRRAKDLRKRRDVYLERFSRQLQSSIQEKTNKASIQANAILDPEAKLSKDELTSISISIFQGGSDTISGTVLWGLSILGQRPDIRQQALADIRERYGEDDALCDAEDDQKCAYVAAFVRECVRYVTVIRLALPRETIQDITYEGRRIRKGTTVWLNAWACNMDPDVWKDPFEFRPDRWIEQPDAPLLTYGLGYRMCPGYHLANREMYLLFLRILNSFEIVATAQVDVSPVTGSSHPEGGRMPKPYKVYFKPRNEAALKTGLENKKAELKV